MLVDRGKEVMEIFSILTGIQVIHFPKLTNLHPQTMCILMYIKPQLKNISLLNYRVRTFVSNEKVEIQSLLGAEAG